MDTGFVDFEVESCHEYGIFLIHFFLSNPWIIKLGLAVDCFFTISSSSFIIWNLLTE